MIENQPLDATIPDEGRQHYLDEADNAFVAGIFSIPLSIGLIGIILSVYSISLGISATSEYKNNPTLYSYKSYKRAKAGTICGITGLLLAGTEIIFLIVYS